MNRTASSFLTVCIPLIVFFTLAYNAFEPMRLNWGDPWSDPNVLTSGRYFRDAGFIRTRLTPVIDVGPYTVKSLKYTHYPPLPDLVNGIMQSAGVQALWHFRMVGIALSALGVLALYLFIKELFGKQVAMASSVLWITNTLWLQYADSLHHIPLYLALGNASLLLGVRWVKIRGMGNLICCAICVFLAYLSSYDVWFFIPLAMVGAIRIALRSVDDRGTKRGWWLGMTLAAAIALAVLTKFGLAIWSFGSVNQFLSDLAFQSHERGSARLFASTFGWLNFRAVLIYRTLRFYSPLFIPLVALVVVSWVAARLSKAFSMREKAISSFQGPLFLLIAGIPFCLAFPQITIEQYHPMLQFLPFYSVGLAFVGCEAWSLCARSGLGKATLLLVGLLLTGWQYREWSCLDKSFFPSEDMALVMKLPQFIRDGPYVVSDFPVDADFRYYLRRHMHGAGYIDALSFYSGLEGFLRPYEYSKVLYIHNRQSGITAFDKIAHVGTGYLGYAANARWVKKEIVKKAQAEGEMIHNKLMAISPLLLQTPSLEVFELNTNELRRAMDSEVRSSGKETDFVDFRFGYAGMYARSGIWNDLEKHLEQWPGHEPIVRYWFWAGYQPKVRYKFTMQITVDGTKAEETGDHMIEPISLRVVLIPSAKHYGKLTLIPTTSGQVIEISMNGQPLCSQKLGRAGKPATVSFVVPGSSLDLSNLQIMGLRFSKMDPQMRAARIMSLGFQKDNPW